MGERLVGKRAIVTAAGQGIGLAIAQRFAAEGATVIATDINRDTLDAAAASSANIETRILDVLDSDAVSAAAREVGTVDILANVAGFVHHGTILDCNEDDWDFSFNINVKSMHRMTTAFLPGMLKAGGGSIINLSSGASSLKGAPNRYAYGATKAAVIGLTKAVAMDFIRDGVRCNAICPGTILSPSLESRIEELGKQVGGVDKAMEMFVERQPMGRLGTVDEVAAMAAYLASDDSAFTTGTALPVDGGWTL